MTLVNPFPAKYSSEVIESIIGLLAPLDVRSVLDPFGGIGGIHELQEHGYETVAVDIEQEFVDEARRTYPSGATLCADSRTLETHPYFAGPDATMQFDACVTSPAYGNRMADQVLPSWTGEYKRYSYSNSLGRRTSEGSGAGVHFGKANELYEQIHLDVWLAVTKLVKPGGHFILNISDFVRSKKIVPVTQWHVTALNNLGWTPLQYVPVNTKRMRHGANGDARTPNEWCILFRKP